MNIRYPIYEGVYRILTDYQIIIFSINFTTKFEEESKNPIVAPCMKKEL